MWGKDTEFQVVCVARMLCSRLCVGQGCCVPGCVWGMDAVFQDVMCGKDAVFQVECGARMLCSRM